MRPVTLCFSGLDPSGGAGLQADIETIAALGGHAAVVATALTVQDSQRVYDFRLTEPALMHAQAERVLADLPVSCVKLGMLGSAAAVTTVFSSLKGYAHLPVVMDPVLSANSGGTLAQSDLRAALLAALPQVSVITPNTVELRLLTGCENLDQAVAMLTQAGAEAIWLKGGHEPGEILINTLYVKGEPIMRSELTRLPGEFHGSGCTLAAALAAGLAAGLSLQDAVAQSQDFVAQALMGADRPRDQGQWLPRRIVTPWRA